MLLMLFHKFCKYFLTRSQSLSLAKPPASIQTIANAKLLCKYVYLSKGIPIIIYFGVIKMDLIRLKAIVTFTLAIMDNSESLCGFTMFFPIAITISSCHKNRHLPPFIFCYCASQCVNVG